MQKCYILTAAQREFSRIVLSFRNEEDVFYQLMMVFGIGQAEKIPHYIRANGFDVLYDIKIEFII